MAGIATARTFTGNTGSRRYLLAAGNNAEMRDSGMVLSYGVVSFDKGKARIERSGSVRELTFAQPVSVPIPEGTQRAIGGLSNNAWWQNVTNTADTTFSGRAMAALYQQATGQGVDGVIYLDVPAISAVLRVLGPVTVEGIGEPITETNVATILLHNLYTDAGTQDDPERRGQLAKIAGALAERMTTASFDIVKLGGALADATAGRHVWLYSNDTAEQTRVHAVRHRGRARGYPS